MGLPRFYVLTFYFKLLNPLGGFNPAGNIYISMAYKKFREDAKPTHRRFSGGLLEKRNLPTVEGYGASMVWFGIVTVVGAEVGLLTPPLGLSCFAIKSTLDDALVSLSDIFYGAAPFALTMLLVLMLLIAYPQLSLVLVH